MADSIVRTPEERRKRVQRIKKIILVFLMIALVTPIVVCICLGIQVSRLNRTIDDLSQRIQTVTELVEDQQKKLEQISSLENVQVQKDEEIQEEIRTTESEPDADNERITEAVTPESAAAHKVYLTFDDGPSGYTDDILDILDLYNIKATFFVVGKEGEWAEEALRDIVGRGHTLGMHSYSHRYSELYDSVEAFEKDYEKLRDYLKDVTGVESKLYRFPGGSSNTVSRIDMLQLIDFLNEREVRYMDWNVSSGDGGSRILSVNELVRNCTMNIEDNAVSVILLHDSTDKKTTVEALPTIIETILALEDTEILPITDQTELVQHIAR